MGVTFIYLVLFQPYSAVILTTNTYSTVQYYFYVQPSELMIHFCCMLCLVIFLIWYLALYNRASHCICC